MQIYVHALKAKLKQMQVNVVQSFLYFTAEMSLSYPVQYLPMVHWGSRWENHFSFLWFCFEDGRHIIVLCFSHLSGLLFKVKIHNFGEAPAALLLEKITQRGREVTIQPVHWAAVPQTATGWKSKMLKVFRFVKGVFYSILIVHHVIFAFDYICGMNPVLWRCLHFGWLTDLKFDKADRKKKIVPQSPWPFATVAVDKQVRAQLNKTGSNLWL